MIIVVGGTDNALCTTLADFLEDRSFNKINLRKGAASPVPTDLSSGQHYVVLDATPEDIAALKHHADTRVVFAGAEVAGDAAMKTVWEIADARFTSETDEKDIVSFIVGALSSIPRPSWDQYFIDIARVVAQRSNCMKRQVAAVLVRDRRVVATGYNGTPKGAKNCNEGGCERCNSLAQSGTGLDDCVCNHAEENAICQAAYHGISIRNATLYSTHSPCLRCAKLLINAGIDEVVYNADYPLSERAKKLMDECGVVCRRYP